MPPWPKRRRVRILPPIAREPGATFLLSTVEVDGTGIHLDQMLRLPDGGKAPHLRIAAAPEFGESEALTRNGLTALLKEKAPEFAPRTWDGAQAVRISRKSRLLESEEVKALLTTRIQGDYVTGTDRLELEFSRNWSPVAIPDEPMDLKLEALPASGLSSYLILRFSVEAGDTKIGPWQVPVRVRVWRNVWVADRPLKRGDLLSADDLDRKAIDSLRFRDAFEFSDDERLLELTQNVVKGAPLTNRHVKLHPVVERGEALDAVFQDGPITISMKVEALEPGVMGQTIRVRNTVSRRLLQGVVRDGRTIIVKL